MIKSNGRCENVFFTFCACACACACVCICARERMRVRARVVRAMRREDLSCTCVCIFVRVFQCVHSGSSSEFDVQCFFVSADFLCACVCFIDIDARTCRVLVFIRIFRGRR